MKRPSIIALSAAVALLSGLARAEAQEAPDVIERPDTPKCSFACAFSGGVPSDPKPVAALAEPVQPEARDVSRRRRAAGGRKIAVAKAVAVSRLRVTHVAAKVAPRPRGPIVAAELARPVSRPIQTTPVVDPRRDEMTSPVVQIESARPAEADALVQRQVAESAADDLHLDARVATGEVEVAGFTRYAPSWDWLITQAHAATVRRPDPYGALDGVRKAF